MYKIRSGGGENGTSKWTLNRVLEWAIFGAKIVVS